MGEELHWLIYLVSFILAAGLFGFALYFDKKGKKEKEAKRKKYNKFKKVLGRIFRLFAPLM